MRRRRARVGHPSSARCMSGDGMWIELYYKGWDGPWINMHVTPNASDSAATSRNLVAMQLITCVLTAWMQYYTYLYIWNITYLSRIVSLEAFNASMRRPPPMERSGPRFVAQQSGPNFHPTDLKHTVHMRSTCNSCLLGSSRILRRVLFLPGGPLVTMASQ